MGVKAQTSKFGIVVILFSAILFLFLATPIKLIINNRSGDALSPEAEFLEHLQGKYGNYCEAAGEVLEFDKTACCSIAAVGISKSQRVKDRVRALEERAKNKTTNKIIDERVPTIPMLCIGNSFVEPQGNPKIIVAEVDNSCATGQEAGNLSIKFKVSDLLSVGDARLGELALIVYARSYNSATVNFAETPWSIKYYAEPRGSGYTVTSNGVSRFRSYLSKKSKKIILKDTCLNEGRGENREYMALLVKKDLLSGKQEISQLVTEVQSIPERAEANLLGMAFVLLGTGEIKPDSTPIPSPTAAVISTSEVSLMHATSAVVSSTLGISSISSPVVTPMPVRTATRIVSPTLPVILTPIPTVSEVENIKELIDNAALRINGQEVKVKGFYSANDGGGGSFVWSDSGIGHNGGTFISPFLTSRYQPGKLGWWNWNPASVTKSGLWMRKQSPTEALNINWFGIFGDGTTDHTAAFYKINTWIQAHPRQSLFFPSGIYRTSYIRIYNGTDAVEGSNEPERKTIIKGIGANDLNGLVQVDGSGLHGNAVDSLQIRNLYIDMSNRDIIGINANECNHCIIENNEIYGFTFNDGTKENNDEDEKKGILLDNASHDTIIRNNRITASFHPDNFDLVLDSEAVWKKKSKNRQNLIQVQGVGPKVSGVVDGFDGYYSNRGERIVNSVTTKAAIPAVNNKISGNILINGTHGIVLNNCGTDNDKGESNIVELNEISGQSHRGIALNTSSYNTVRKNIIKNYQSSAVLLGYLSTKNTISGNTCLDESPFLYGEKVQKNCNDKVEICEKNGKSGEASININTGSSYNTIENNAINARRPYGIYMAVGMKGNIVRGNTVQSFYRVGIALENDWAGTGNLPSLARYSRANFAEASTINNLPKGHPDINNYAFKDSELNIIENNIIKDPFYASTPTCGIYIAQLSPAGRTLITKNMGNTIRGNKIESLQLNHNFYLFEEDLGLSTQHVLTGNIFPDSKSEKIAVSQPNAGNFAVMQVLPYSVFNLIKNPLFESNFTNWTHAHSAKTTGKEEIVSGQCASTGKCLKLTKGTASAVYALQVVGALDPSLKYKLNAKFKSGSTRNGYITLFDITAAKTVASKLLAGNGGWRNISLDIAGASLVAKHNYRILLYGQSGSAAGSVPVYYDDIELRID